MKTDKKSQLLGMNFSTGRARLDRDLLFKCVVELGHKCYRCGGDLTREEFSVDHKDNWSLAEDPVKAFFDLDNIAFSHLHCNTKEMADRRRTKEHGRHMYRKHGCRCDICKAGNMKDFVYDKHARRERYVRLGT